MDIKEKARKLIYQSPIINYFDVELIEKVFENIHVITDERELKEKYYEATGIRYVGTLEGFQNSSGLYIGPRATPHTIIHEILHSLSSKFDENNRILNGIMGEPQAQSKNYFGLILNEGLTDYLAAKISHEEPRHYINGHNLFSNLEGGMIDYFEDPEILFSIYFNNNVTLFKDFLDNTVKKGAGQLLYERFNFMDKDEINKFAQTVNSGVKKSVRFRNIKRTFDKFKSFFGKKTLALPKGRGETTIPFNKRRQIWLKNIIIAQTNNERTSELNAQPGIPENIRPDKEPEEHSQ